MKKLAISTLCAVALCGVASAQSLRAEATMLDNRCDQLMKKRDYPALKKAMRSGVTANFRYEEDAPGKGQDFEAMFKNMKMGLSQLKKVTICSSKILTIKENGNRGTGTTQRSLGGITIGPDKKEHTAVYSGITTDTYVKVGGKWLVEKMSWRTTSMTMDGKPIPMPKASGAQPVKH